MLPRHQDFPNAVRKILPLFLCILAFSGCLNILAEVAKKDSDEAIYKAALIAMDSRDYAAAITDFQKLSTTFIGQRSVTVNYASAFAGRCGLDLLLLVDSIKTNASANLFITLMKNFKGATTTNISDCLQAETLIRSINNSAASRNVDENLLMVFVSFAKIGAILATYADTNADGTPDAGFDSCNTTQFPNAKAREVASAINLIVDSLSGPGVPTLLGAATTSLTSICTTLAGISATYAFCGANPAVTDPTAYTANQIKALNGVIKTTDFPGLGTCNNTTVNCICP